MSTITVFDKIQKNIILQLRQAENRIRICVAWLTDDEILEVLIQQAGKGIYIEIILLNDEYNLAKSNHFNKLKELNSEVYFVNSNSENGKLHHKFCLIDYFVLITGSYNWTNNAKRNNENIIIVDRNNEEDSTEDEYNLFFKYDKEFDEILVEYGIEQAVDEDTMWENALEYSNQQKKTFNEAGDYFDLAMDYLKSNDYDNGLEAINEAIKINPYFKFYSVRHVIYRKQKKIYDCCDDLFLYMKDIYSDDFNEIKKFKALYNDFIDYIRYAENNYKFITRINEKTRNNLGSFAYLDLEPHFFTFDELEAF
jgi:tetratricopeptide (TPR) repeat protein